MCVFVVIEQYDGVSKLVELFILLTSLHIIIGKKREREKTGYTNQKKRRRENSYNEEKTDKEWEANSFKQFGSGFAKNNKEGKNITFLWLIYSIRQKMGLLVFI